MQMQSIPRPAHLDASSPKQALLSFHAEQAGHNRQQITEQMLFELEELRHSQAAMINPSDWWADMETLKWEDGSILAVFRDRMKFHEQCVEFLTHV